VKSQRADAGSAQVFAVCDLREPVRHRWQTRGRRVA